jgi:pimeloyl-ACP methyl ester carboxylesterase
MSEYIAIFTADAGRTRYFAAYDAVLELWEVPYTCRMLSTSAGQTHVIISGSPKAPPLLLLHPGNMSATVWFPNVAALSRDFRVYAIDTLCDLGKSVPTRFLDSRAASAEWLREVITALGLSTTHMIGGSYGGWLTLNFAVHYPEYLRQIGIFAPAASFETLDMKAYLAMVKYNRNNPERGMEAFVRPGYQVHDCFRRQIAEGIRSFTRITMKVARPVVFSDEELSRIDVPALVLYGEHEPFCNPHKALERAGCVLPHVEAELIPNAGHVLSMDHADDVNARIREFLKNDHGAETITEESCV